MELLRNEQPSSLLARPRPSFLEERDKFLQNIEQIRKTQARVAELKQKINEKWDQICTARIDRNALRREIDSRVQAVNQPLIGRQLPAEPITPGPVSLPPAVSYAIPPEELYLFLLALNDVVAKYGFIDELQYVLQRQELERLKPWPRDRKNWLPPESN